MPTRSQRTAVTLAFVAALLSLAAAALGFVNRGEINVTPLVGGVFMLALGIVGYRRLRKPPPSRPPSRE
jgi:hypothetical protein